MTPDENEKEKEKEKENSIKINVVFVLSTGPAVRIIANENSLFKEVVNLLIKKINLEEVYTEGRLGFIWNSSLIEPNSNKTLRELYIKNNLHITVYDDRNVIIN